MTGLFLSAAVLSDVANSPYRQIIAVLETMIKAQSSPFESVCGSKVIVYDFGKTDNL